MWPIHWVHVPILRIKKTSADFGIVTRKSQKSQKFLPLNPWEAYANGAGKDIEFLQGCNRDEMRTFLGAIGVDRWNEWAKGRIEEKLALLTDEEKALVKSYYDDIQGESYEASVSLCNQFTFVGPQIRLSEEHTKGGGKSYTYYFTAESAVPCSTVWSWPRRNLATISV